MQHTISVRGVEVPRLMYGTAWKEEATEGLVAEALAAGFRAIDTANQRKHYYEEGVGRALAEAFSTGALRREDVFLQTKFTFVGGQDHRLPYDPRAPIAEQVSQSFESSLAHLGVTGLDSLVLHGPSRRVGLGPADVEAWTAMEALRAGGHVRLLGVSNIATDQLRDLCGIASEPPAFVQNRCFARFGWDAGVRALCEEHGIAYQGFSLLTANRDVVASREVEELARRHGRTAAQVIFRYCLQLGMIALTGTTDRAHMDQDLAVMGFELSADEMATIPGGGAR